MDSLTPAQRSERMARVKHKDTGPELIVRRLLSEMGYRYRLHGRHLPGNPDLVFAGRRKVIFIHGCFWHRHRAKTCRLARMPKSRLDFWAPKLEGNRRRDARNQRALRAAGWKFLVVWECQLHNTKRLRNRFARYLGDGACGR